MVVSSDSLSARLRSCERAFEAAKSPGGDLAYLGRAMISDRVYFARRALDERAAASTAVHEQARQAHAELAIRYEELSAAIGSNGSGADVEASQYAATEIANIADIETKLRSPR